jgi:integrase
MLHAHVLEQTDAADWWFHNLRRTMASWQAGTGANLSAIGRSLNHKTTQTTAIYARLWMAPVLNSMETATIAMMQAAGLAAPDESESEAAEE